MKSNDLISVIVPIYNPGKYLADCVNSIVAQTYRDLEIVLVDDGSTDESPEICRHFVSLDPRVKFISHPNRGQSVARNRGLDYAHGRWIMFVDSDDALVHDCIELLKRNLDDTLSEISVAPFRHKTWESDADLSEVLVMSGREAAECMLYQNRDEWGLTVSPCAKLFDRNLIDNWRFTPGTIYEDLELLPRIVASAKSVCATRTPVYHYRISHSSTLGKFNPRRLAARDISEGTLKYFEDDPILKPAAEDRLMSAAFNMLLLMGKYGYEDPQLEASCRSNIRTYRRAALSNPKVRLRNKIGVIISYLCGVGVFKTRIFGRLFLKR